MKAMTRTAAIVTSILICLTSVTHAEAQDKVSLGVKAAWDYSIPSTNLVGMDGSSGVSAGVVCNIPFAKSMYFEPGLLYYYDTMNLSLLQVEFNGHDVSSGYWSNMGFRVPMIFGYKFDLVDNISISVFTGPQLNVGLACDMHYDGFKHVTGNLYDDHWGRLEMQWMVGLKLHYMNNFFAEIGGGFGLNDMLSGKKYDNSHFRHNIFNIGLGYMF